ncbi:TetR/AcrR family transcriptional regulator [Pseudoclavibacter helvolus]|uniref:TetR/AcrR family transcriptional regulator n=1 Tax=Pseudoclavibacter helvolus TaxID=255205 RepID=UPI003C7424DA
MGPKLSKGEIRRQAILTAAVTVVAESGAGSLTHRAVAAEAAVSLASTTYHFASIDELRQMTFIHAADIVGEQFETALNSARSPAQRLDDAATRWAEVLIEQRSAFVTVLEMLVAATRDTELQAVSAELLAQSGATLERAGFTAAQDLASELIGLALVHLTDPDRHERAFRNAALASMHRHAASHSITTG